MKETSLTISAWASQTFGEPDTLKTATRTLLEIAELKAIVARKGATELVREEVADVTIMVAQCAVGVNMLIEGDGVTPYANDLASLSKHSDLELAQDLSQHFDDFLGMLIRERHSIFLRAALMGVYLRLIVMGKRNGASDLWQAVTEKMATNRKRKWQRGADGLGRHVDEVQEAA